MIGLVWSSPALAIINTTGGVVPTNVPAVTALPAGASPMRWISGSSYTTFCKGNTFGCVGPNCAAASAGRLSNVATFARRGPAPGNPRLNNLQGSIIPWSSRVFNTQCPTGHRLVSIYTGGVAGHWNRGPLTPAEQLIQAETLYTKGPGTAPSYPCPQSNGGPACRSRYSKIRSAAILAAQNAIIAAKLPFMSLDQKLQSAIDQQLAALNRCGSFLSYYNAAGSPLGRQGRIKVRGHNAGVTRCQNAITGASNPLNLAIVAARSAIVVANTPTANAGPAQSTWTGYTALLDGSFSTDPSNDPLTYSWSILSTPVGSTAVINLPTSVSPGFVPDLTGTYKIGLTVSDSVNTSLVSTVVITATDLVNATPVANAGVSGGIVTIGQPAGLSSLGSTDADGNPLTRSWRLIASPVGSAATITTPTGTSPGLTTDVAGAFTFELTVNDGFVDSLPVQVTVIAQVPNIAPIANAGVNAMVFLGDTVFLDGSLSTDVDGIIISYTWAVDSAPVGSTATLIGANTVAPSFTPDMVGSYFVSLIVNDGVANSTKATKLIAATVNMPPVASVLADLSVGTTGMTVNFDSTLSTDPEGNLLTVSWNFGDATSLTNVGAGALASHTFNTPGTYAVTATVTDGYGNSSQAVVTIVVSAPAPLFVADTATGGTNGNSGDTTSSHEGIVLSLDVELDGFSIDSGDDHDGGNSDGEIELELSFEGISSSQLALSDGVIIYLNKLVLVNLSLSDMDYDSLSDTYSYSDATSHVVLDFDEKHGDEGTVEVTSNLIDTSDSEDRDGVSVALKLGSFIGADKIEFDHHGD